MRKSLLSSLFEKRSEKVNPIHPGDPALSVLFGGGASTSSGIYISEQTAMTINAVYSAVNIIAETIAMLPWNFIERDGNNKNPALNDPRFTLVHDQPNRWQNSFEFRELVISQLLLTGRSVSELIMNRSGVITDIVPLAPGTYKAFRAPDGTIAFQQFMSNGGSRILLSDEVMDLRGHPDPWDPVNCISPIKNNSNTLGINKAAEDYAGTFFGNGTVVSGVLETDEALSENAYQRLKEWTERHQGVARSHNPAILEQGLKWRQTSVNAEDAQLIETRKYQIEDVARIYRIPSYKLASMDRANFNNVEQQSIDFVTDTILPRTVRLEKAMDRAILLPQELRKYFTEVKINGLLRGDSATRAAFYKDMWSMSVYSANDIRAFENENPVEDGDRRYVPVNYMPTDKVDDTIDNNATPATQDKNRAEPFVRSIFDRIITAQCKIVERCGNDEEKMTAAMVEHRKFLERNVNPLVDSFGESVNTWVDEYYTRTLKELQRSDHTIMLDHWKTDRIEHDIEDFYRGIL